MTELDDSSDGDQNETSIPSLQLRLFIGTMPTLLDLQSEYNEKNANIKKNRQAMGHEVSFKC